MIKLNVEFQGYEITIFDNAIYSTVLIQELIKESEMTDDTQVRYWIGRKHSVEDLFHKPLAERTELEETLIRFFDNKVFPMYDLLPQEFNLTDYEFLDEDTTEFPE